MLLWRIFERTGGQNAPRHPFPITAESYNPAGYGWWGCMLRIRHLIIAAFLDLSCLDTLALLDMLADGVSWDRYAKTMAFLLIAYYPSIIFHDDHIFTLFEPGNIVFGWWAYIHWKFWFNEVCAQFWSIHRPTWEIWLLISWLKKPELDDHCFSIGSMSSFEAMLRYVANTRHLKIGHADALTITISSFICMLAFPFS
jgi:hypothetical protein